VKKWLIVFGGFLLAMALVILGRDGRALRNTEKDRDARLATGIKKEQVKAEKLNKKAERHKEGAKLAAEETRKRLEANSEKRHDLDDLLSAFESERVRQSKPG
jgi:predicted Holliday junction resolvase-like endonuclease